MRAEANQDEPDFFFFTTISICFRFFFCVCRSRSKMVQYCRVQGCHHRNDRDKHVQFYRLPKVVQCQGEQTLALSEERRQLWLARLKQNLHGKNLENVRICSAHFVSGKKADLYQRDNPDWAPSLNMVEVNTSVGNSDGSMLAVARF
ncbi:hypothetical protein AALO_G00046890 [Alosa alosa]|uniref:THAP-type domain-containing protein n=1 Tax=Alosa alosa TaxID=278164 RepID=A0AAV6H874_9TELE|nr:hypothetical protein AALO_G00046890 [Alosa alosa]